MPAVLLLFGAVLMVAGVHVMFGLGPALAVAGVLVFAAGVDLARTPRAKVAQIPKRERWTGLAEDEAAA